MCALGHYLEHAGILTTGISLVRENAASLQPPRTLWVSFPLGRPLGVPQDAAFQHRVIAASLDLLNRLSGPVLEDFPEDAPTSGEQEAPACSVRFVPQAKDWRARLLGELGALAPWYEMGLKRRDGRTLVGVCDAPIDQILEAFAHELDANRLPMDLVWFKAALEDAKAYYVEALTAQPGTHDADETYARLWHETQLGAALRVFYDGFASEPESAGFARIILPRSALEAP